MPLIIPQNQNNSPLDRIATALKIVGGVYGIKADTAALDKAKQEASDRDEEMGQKRQAFQNTQTEFAQKQAALARSMDPDSTESKLARADATGFLSTLASSETGKKNPEAFSPLLSLAQDPTTNAATLHNAFETSPLLKNLTTITNKDSSLAYLGAALANRNQNTQEKTDLGANKQYGSEMGPYEKTIQAANRADEIINRIKSGELKSTPTLRNDLNSAVGSMFNNGKGATVYSMSHSDQDSLFGRIQKGTGFITGTAQDTIPPEQLDQLQKDVQALKGSYLDAHDVAFSSFKEGLPDRVKQSLENRFNTFRERAGSPSSKAAPTQQEVVPGVTQDAVAAEIARRNAAKGK